MRTGRRHLECVQLFGDNDLYGVVCACQIVQTDQLRELDDRLAAQADDVLKRLLNRVVQTHHDGERNELGQTAAHRADAAAFIERLDFLVELGAVVCVLLLKLLHFRVERGHGEHALLALDGKRYAAQLDNQREQDNGKAVVVHEIIQAEQDQTERSDDQNAKEIRVFDQVGKLFDGHKNLQKCAPEARDCQGSCFSAFLLPCGSTHKIQSAQQIDKNRGRVPRFLYFQREKSFCIGTFFRPCFAKSKHILSEKRQFFRQILRHRVIGASFGEGMTAADAFECQPASLECAVLLNRLKGVLRAGRRIAAAGRFERREILPVEPHERQKQPLHG